jgi:hypothetical protein
VTARRNESFSGLQVAVFGYAPAMFGLLIMPLLLAIAGGASCSLTVEGSRVSRLLGATAADPDIDRNGAFQKVAHVHSFLDPDGISDPTATR